jgi:hypothetical protein
MSSNQKKNQTLGMPHGTAMGRLRKNILFHLLGKYKENVCFRCGTLIELVKDLSIEHKKPWEGISAELFWDLENIAFSHIACNRPHRLYSPKIITPEGRAWCSRHQASFPISEFHKDLRNDDGFQAYCKSCRKDLDTRKNHVKKLGPVVQCTGHRTSKAVDVG